MTTVARPARTIKFEKSPMVYLVSDECPLLCGAKREGHENPCAAGVRNKDQGEPDKRTLVLMQCPHFKGVTDEVDGEQRALCAWKAGGMGIGDASDFGAVKVVQRPPKESA